MIVKTSTPDILEGDTFHKFWLAWYGDKIEMAKFGEAEPIFSKKIKKDNNIKFVTFLGRNQKKTLHWKVLRKSLWKIYFV